MSTLLAHTLKLANLARIRHGYRVGDYIRTYSGERFYVLDPRPEEIDIQDIAHHLSLVCRFVGGIRTMYSVAEHSVRVSDWLMDATGDVELALWGLLHDASEAYLGDVTRPLKQSWLMFGYRFIERRVSAAIAQRFELRGGEPASVKEVDARICITEARDLRIAARGDISGVRRGYQPLPITIKPWTSAVAERQFLARFERLMRLRYAPIMDGLFARDVQ